MNGHVMGVQGRAYKEAQSDINAFYSAYAGFLNEMALYSKYAMAGDELFARRHNEMMKNYAEKMRFLLKVIASKCRDGNFAEYLPNELKNSWGEGDYAEYKTAWLSWRNANKGIYNHAKTIIDFFSDVVELWGAFEKNIIPKVRTIVNEIGSKCSRENGYEEHEKYSELWELWRMGNHSLYERICGSIGREVSITSLRAQRSSHSALARETGISESSLKKMTAEIMGHGHDENYAFTYIRSIANSLRNALKIFNYEVSDASFEQLIKIFFAIAEKESSFSPNCVNSLGYAGPLQVGVSEKNSIIERFGQRMIHYGIDPKLIGQEREQVGAGFLLGFLLFFDRGAGRGAFVFRHAGGQWNTWEVCNGSAQRYYASVFGKSMPNKIHFAEKIVYV